MMGLFDDLTGDSENKIGLHGFFAALKEYARGEITKGNVASNYGIAGGDTQGQALLTLIDNETGEDAKIKKIVEIYDVLTLYEGADSNAFYPTKNDVTDRLGV